MKKPFAILFHRRYLLNLMFLWILLLWQLSRLAEGYCHGVAECACESKPSQGVYIDCRSQGFTQVPRFQGHPDITFYEINLSGNKISNLSEDAFHGMKFKRILLLENFISEVSPAAFKGMEEVLEELMMTMDPSVDLPVEAWEILTKLTVLEIHNYGKKSITPSAFDALTELRQLSLVKGQLQEIRATDLKHLAKLQELDLSSNTLTAVPEMFTTAVGNMSVLKLNLNHISRITGEAFSGLNRLEILDLSFNPISQIDATAFRGLENKFRVLSLKYCQFQDSSLAALELLQSVQELYIPGNSIRSIDGFLSEMRNLRVLDVQENRIESLTRMTYRSIKNSLKFLDLSKNPLTVLPPDTFSSLTQLQELQMNDIQGLRLADGIFAAQKDTLETLSLKGVEFSSDTQWTAISNLTALRNLVLSSCAIKVIPDFLFMHTVRLENLDLTANALTEVTQKSLAGLQYSLIRLSLNGNSISTLDSCVFYEFKNIDFSQLGLNNNPLKCDCSLKWLYDALKRYHGPVLWRCDDGEEFKSLPESTFADCPTSKPQCESFLPDFSGHKDIEVRVENVEGDSVSITWATSPEITGNPQVYLKYRMFNNSDNAWTETTLPGGESRYVITDLQSNTAYAICVNVMKNGALVGDCVNVTTAMASAVTDGLSTQVIIGISVGAGAVLLLIILMVCVLVVRASRRQSYPKIISPPKEGGKTKRFIKTTSTVMGDEDAPWLRSPEETSPNLSPQNAIIAHTLGQMSDEERYRLVNLLTNSTNSLNDLDLDISNGGVRRTRGASMKAAGNSMPFLNQISVTDKHVYEEIPDEYFRGTATLPAARQSVKRPDDASNQTNRPGSVRQSHAGQQIRYQQQPVSARQSNEMGLVGNRNFPIPDGVRQSNPPMQVRQSNVARDNSSVARPLTNSPSVTANPVNQFKNVPADTQTYNSRESHGTPIDPINRDNGSMKDAPEYAKVQKKQSINQLPKSSDSLIGRPNSGAKEPSVQVPKSFVEGNSQSASNEQRQSKTANASNDQSRTKINPSSVQSVDSSVQVRSEINGNSENINSENIRESSEPSSELQRLNTPSSGRQVQKPAPPPKNVAVRQPGVQRDSSAVSGGQGLGNGVSDSPSNKVRHQISARKSTDI